jgi:hypothetical protein
MVELYLHPMHIHGVVAQRHLYLYVACAREIRNAYNIFVGKPNVKRPLRRFRRRYDNIKLDLGKTGGAGVIWIQEGIQRRAVVNTPIQLQIP